MNTLPEVETNESQDNPIGVIVKLLNPCTTEYAEMIFEGLKSKQLGLVMNMLSGYWLVEGEFPALFREFCLTHDTVFKVIWHLDWPNGKFGYIFDVYKL